MVTINTEYQQEHQQQYGDVVLTYLVELPRSKCFFGSARDSRTGKLHLFLVFNHQGKIYSRRPLNETWEEIHNTSDYDKIRRMVSSALYYKTVPCYSTENSLTSLN